MARTRTTFTKDNPGPGRPPLTPEQRDAKAALRLLGPDVVARCKQLLQSDDEKVAAQMALGLLKSIGLDAPTEVKVEGARSPLASLSVEELVACLEIHRERVRATSAAQRDSPADSAPRPTDDESP